MKTSFSMFSKPFAKREKKTPSFSKPLQRKLNHSNKFMAASKKNKNFTPDSLVAMRGNNLVAGEILQLRLFSKRFSQTTAIQIKKLIF